MRTRHCTWLAAASLGVLGIASTSRAAVVAAVDVLAGTSTVYSGTFTSPVDGSTGSFTGGTFTDSQLSFSVSTAADSSGTVSFAISGFNSNSDRGSANDAGTYQALYQTVAIVNAGTLTIGGLNPSTQYGVVLQGYEPAAPTYNSVFTPATSGVTNPAGQATIIDTTNASPSNYLYGNPAGNLGNVEFDGANALTTDTSGNIVFDLNGQVDTSYVRINGIEIYTVPEPASLGFLAVAGCAFLIRRRRSPVIG